MPVIEPDIFDLIFLIPVTFSTLFLMDRLHKSAESPWFIALVFLVRILLFLPYLLINRKPKTSNEPASGRRAPQPAANLQILPILLALIAVPVAALIRSAIGQVSQEQRSVFQIWQGLNSGMAVRALGWDVIIGVSSFFLIGFVL